MIFDIDKEFKNIKPVGFKNIREINKENEKRLENLLKRLIGDEIFPDLLVFGNERQWQKEADIFALNNQGDLILIELKVDGHYDRGKIYQVMDYAQIFSEWQYGNINDHFKKCFPNEKVEIAQKFHENFGFELDLGKFNRKQKMIIVSNSSSYSVNNVLTYWKRQDIDIEEYFYRFYEYGDRIIFELSNELYWQSNFGHCWVNTCERYKSGSIWDMVAKEKASAYGDRKDVIGDWMDKGYIFLYHNGYGIIAGGIGTKFISDDGYEKSIKLKKFIHGIDLENQKILKYLSPSTIKEVLGQNFYFPNTIVPLAKEQGELLYKKFKNEITS
jgi:hypothetical protein